MAPEEALKQEAAWAARACIGNDANREIEYRSRFQSFIPRLDHAYQCPKCWIRDGIRSSLRPVHGTDEYDVLRCNRDACGVDVIVPI